MLYINMTHLHLNICRIGREEYSSYV